MRDARYHSKERLMSSAASRKLKVLTFVSYYLPGYKSGGSTRTIANLVHHLSDEFEFWVVTRDRDLGDSEAFCNVTLNVWHQVGKGHVLYVARGSETVLFFKALIKETPHDILYLNSFFDENFTVKPLLGRRLSKRLAQKPVILAPRGELSLSALSLKKGKKKLGIAVAKLLGLYDAVTFHASTELECGDIAAALGLDKDQILIAIDLPMPSGDAGNIISSNKQSNVGVVQIVFLSRIAPIKNLDVALEILGLVKRKVQFDIYGPIEDASYWADCLRAISALPENISVKYRGAIHYAQAQEIFAQYDIFLFPTRGENYGHVIAESLSAGTPVLISDQTPWKNMEMDGLGWDLELKSRGAFAAKIESFSLSAVDRGISAREAIKRNAAKRMCSSQAILDNRQLFRSSLGS